MAREKDLFDFDYDVDGETDTRSYRIGSTSDSWGATESNSDYFSISTDDFGGLDDDFGC